MPTKRKKGSFTGSTVVINLPEYRILASLDSRKLGRRISELSDTQTAQKLESIIKKAKKEYKLINKLELLDQWVTAFTDELKPRLHVNNFEFLEDYDRQNWRNFPLQEGTFWGGEPGADLLTNNLRPAEYTLYTHKRKPALMTEYKLKPNPEGNVKIYKPYWTIKTEEQKAAPPLVIYTDLMATGEPRNVNIAKEIHAQYLTHIT